MKIISLVGARPQFIKEAVLSCAVREGGAWEHVVVHSGQHYDGNMSKVFFDELGITEPKYNMNIGSGNHGAMTAAALAGFEEILLKENPDKIIVYGDTNTTLAGAIAASKLKIPIAHVEAGLRQEPRDMPEEINRVLTDRISTWLFCCSALGVENLAKEGIVSGVSVAGDIMYDLFLKMRKRFDMSVAKNLNLREGKFILTTLHRDFNVDDAASLTNIIDGISRAARSLRLDVLFSIHPRTGARIKNFGLAKKISEWRVIEPIGYFELMGLLEQCAFVVTDSGGLQKEAWFGGKRAAVVMPDSGWRELIDCGWNVLVPQNDKNFGEKIENLTQEINYPRGLYGDGNTARKIISELSKG